MICNTNSWQVQKSELMEIPHFHPRTSCCYERRRCLWSFSAGCLLLPRRSSPLRGSVWPAAGQVARTCCMLIPRSAICRCSAGCFLLASAICVTAGNFGGQLSAICPRTACRSASGEARVLPPGVWHMGHVDMMSVQCGNVGGRSRRRFCRDLRHSGACLSGPPGPSPASR